MTPIPWAGHKICEVHNTTGSPAAKGLLERIGKQFHRGESIRGKFAGRTPPGARQEQAAPLLHSLKLQMEAVLGKINGKSTFARAIRYALSRWSAFTRYTTDGRSISATMLRNALKIKAFARRPIVSRSIFISLIAMLLIMHPYAPEK